MKIKEDLSIYHIAALIRAHIQGSSTPGQDRELEAWLAGAPERRKLIGQLTDNQWRADELAQMLIYHSRGKWQLIEQRARRKKRLNIVRRYCAVASVVVLLIGFSLFTFLDRLSDPIVGVVVDQSAMARLTTVKGEIILLDSVTREWDNQIALTGDNQIVFRANDSVVASAAEVKYNTLEIMRGGEYQIVLPDGSVVYLNSQTTLKFPEDFSGAADRRVFLTGEALFKVSKDEHKPFIVECGDYSVKVLGTVFNVSNYPDDLFSHTTLREGKVEISRGAEHIVLAPGSQALWQDGRFTVQQVNVENYTTWMDENFRFESETIDRILKRLARWYDIEVFYINPDIKNYHFSGYLPRYGKIADVLGLLGNTTDIHFEVKGKTVLVGKK